MRLNVEEGASEGEEEAVGIAICLILAEAADDPPTKKGGQGGYCMKDSIYDFWCSSCRCISRTPPPASAAARVASLPPKVKSASILGPTTQPSLPFSCYRSVPPSAAKMSFELAGSRATTAGEPAACREEKRGGGREGGLLQNAARRKGASENSSCW